MSHRFRVRAPASTRPARTGLIQLAARWHSCNRSRLHRLGPAVDCRRGVERIRTRTRARARLLLRLILNRRTPALHRQSAALPTLQQRFLLKATSTTTMSMITTSALLSAGRRMISRMRTRTTSAFQHTAGIFCSASPPCRATRRLCTTNTAAGTDFELQVFIFYCSCSEFIPRLITHNAFYSQFLTPLPSPLLNSHIPRSLNRLPLALSSLSSDSLSTRKIVPFILFKYDMMLGCFY